MNDSYTEDLDECFHEGAAGSDRLSITYGDTTTVELRTTEPLEDIETFIQDRYTDSKRYGLDEGGDLDSTRHYTITDIDTSFEMAMVPDDHGTAVFIEHSDPQGAYEEARNLTTYLDS